MARLIDGKAAAAAVRAGVAERVAAYKERNGYAPGLAVLIVGENPASQVYVRNKKKACEEVGIFSDVRELPEETTMDELLAVIAELRENDRIHGILVQLPLPKHLDPDAVILAIPPEKDVDAFHPVNLGRLLIGDAVLKPCTPSGIMRMLQMNGIDPAGKDCVVIGRSTIVGKPMALLLTQANGTVTLCHTKTKDLAEKTRRAEILVSAVGKAGFVTADMVAEGAVVIDVGMNRDENGKLCGDCDFAALSEKVSAITPVPGGVGPMTVAMLMENTITAAEALEG